MSNTSDDSAAAPHPEDLRAQQAAAALRQRTGRLDDDALDLLFREARSHHGWLDRPLSDDLIRELYELVKMAPTSMNCSPSRFVFIRSPEGKERLRPALSPGNIEKAMSAPVIAVIGTDEKFYDQMGRLFPRRDVRRNFADDPKKAAATAFRNGTLQGAYLILAARSLGLDCGPMSGFQQGPVDEAFFAGTSIRSNFLCCLGYGDAGALFRRHPRFEFDDVCQLA